jgi:hypothetical protein
LFEALTMTLVANMPVRAAAKMVGEHDTLLWRMIHHYVGAAESRMNLAAVSRVAIDETAAKRGHNYISLFVDIDERNVVFVTEGKDAKTVAAFADHLEDHGGEMLSHCHGNLQSVPRTRRTGCAVSEQWTCRSVFETLKHMDPRSAKGYQVRRGPVSMWKKPLP